MPGSIEDQRNRLVASQIAIVENELSSFAIAADDKHPGSSLSALDDAQRHLAAARDALNSKQYQTAAIHLCVANNYLICANDDVASLDYMKDQLNRALDRLWNTGTLLE